MTTPRPNPPRLLPARQASFGELLHQYRMAVGLSQEALAEQAGLSAGGLSLLENGRRQAPYRHTVTLLARALDLSTAETALLEAAVPRSRRRADAGSDSLPSVWAAPEPTSNLPVQLTSFIGREREMVEVADLLASMRLLTLTGTGGVGKTRLALQVAHAVCDRYAQGAWLVELAPLADPALVPSVVLGALLVPEQPGRLPVQALIDALRTRQLLLVLDNCEHLLDGCARLVEALLRACPRLRILATSREPLGLAGEQRWRVPSLAVPPTDQTASPALVASYEAVHLFLERARAVQPQFALTAANAAAVVKICACLDGIPLALELAAARLGALGVAELAARLDQRLRLLTGGSRTALPRQQTLRATVEWSYDLLMPEEQTLFNRLSVFAGGWDLEGAEAVGAGGTIATEEVLDLLGGLVNKSLVLLEEPQQEAEDGRYRLLETVRQYGRERLVASGNLEELRRQHAAYFRDRSREAGLHLLGPHQAHWLDQLECEHGNLRAALRWAIEDQDAALGLRLAASLSYFWEFRGHFGEGRALRAAVLGLPAGQDLAALRAELLHGNGMLALHQGDYPAASAFLEEALAIARSEGDRRLLAQTLTTLGLVARVQDEFARARAALEESLTLARAVGDTFLIARALHHLGMLAFEADHDDDAAWRLNAEGLALFRQIGNRRMIGSVLSGLSRMARARGDAPGAGAALVEAFAAFRDLGDVYPMSHVLSTLAALEADAGRLERAIRLQAAAAKLEESIGARVWPEIRRERDEWLEPARRALEDEGFARVWAEGQAMTLEQAVAFALEVLLLGQGSLVRKPPELRSMAVKTANSPRRSRAERHAWVLAHLRAVGSLSPREYVAALGLERRTAVRDLRALETRGLVEALGTTTNRRYVLQRQGK